MSLNLNEATVMGLVASEPVIIVSPDGKRMAHLTVVTKECWTTRSGGRHERSDTHRVVVLEPLIDYVEEQIRRGSYVYAKGRLQVRKITNSLDEDRNSVEIVVHVHGVIEIVTAPTSIGAAA